MKIEEVRLKPNIIYLNIYIYTMCEVVGDDDDVVDAGAGNGCCGDLIRCFQIAAPSLSCFPSLFWLMKLLYLYGIVCSDLCPTDSTT